jgi:hypothetical protein
MNRARSQRGGPFGRSFVGGLAIACALAGPGAPGQERVEEARRSSEAWREAPVRFDPVGPRVRAVEQLPAGRVQVEFAEPVVAARSLVLAPDGSELPLQRQPDGSVRAVLETGRTYLHLDPLRPAVASLGTTPVEFPARYLTARPAGPGAPPPLWAGGFGLWAERAPLVWDEVLGAFATTLLLAYQFEDGAERPLPVPRTVRFFVEGAGAEIREDRVEITHSGLGRAQSVRLLTRELFAPTIVRVVAGPHDELRLEATVRREPARFALVLQPESPPGWGIGTAALSLRLLARDGGALPPAAPLEIQLTARKLALPATVTLAAGQEVVSLPEVRGLGVGRDRIAAHAGPVTGELDVRLAWPVAPIVAALVGGWVGGYLRFLRLKQRRPLLVKRLVEGVLAGLLFTAAVWAGLVAVLDTAGVLGTPLGAWVLAALGGYAGSAVLDPLVRRVTGAGAPDSGERPR